MARPVYQTAVSPKYRRRAFVQILMGGPGGMKDVTDALDPHLISVQVLLKDFGPSVANIELDDRDGSLPIPPDRAPVKILIGWAGSGPTLPLSEHVKRVYGLVIPDQYIDGSPIVELPYYPSGMQMIYMGQITSVESGFSRNGGGRRLWIETKASHDKNDGKTPASLAVGEGAPDSGSGTDIKLSEFMAKVAWQHGFSLTTQGVSDIKRPFWMQDNESFLALGQRMAQQFGLKWRVWGNKAYLTSPDVEPSGALTSTIEATWGVNLIGWRIKPYAGRAQWKDSQQRFFDIWNGLWKDVTQEITGTTPFANNQARAGLPSAAPNSQAGVQMNNGADADSTENRGTGWVIINGEPAAAALGRMIIAGARPGVDGRYRITEAEHNYTRGGGYTTRCQLKKPQFSPNEYTYWQAIESMGTAEIERQLQEHPFFAWQEGQNQVPQILPNIVRHVDGGTETINPNTGEEAWEPDR